MEMIAKIRKVGNSKGIIIPQNVLSQLHGAAGREVEEVELHVEGNCLVLVPRHVRYASREEFARARDKVFRKYRKLNENLAKR